MGVGADDVVDARDRHLQAHGDSDDEEDDGGLEEEMSYLRHDHVPDRRSRDPALPEAAPRYQYTAIDGPGSGNGGLDRSGYTCSMVVRT